MRAQFLTVDGVRFRVLTEGSGPPVLLLHPIGHCADLFIRNIDVLARNLRVIAPDLPGHGFTDATGFGQAAPQLATCELLSRLMQALDAPSFAVVGSSYGGLVAALMAHRFPDRVRRLVIIGSSSTFSTDVNQEKTLRAVAANAATAMRSPTLDACRRRLGNICFDVASVAEEVLPIQVTCYALEDRYSAFVDTIEGVIASLPVLTAQMHSRLDELTMPVLTIVGRNDIRAGWAQHEQGTAGMRDGRCMVFEECGHLPFMEHPGGFNDAVAAFLSPMTDA